MQDILTLREKHEYEQEIEQFKGELMSKAKTIVSLEGEIKTLQGKVRYTKSKLTKYESKDPMVSVTRSNKVIHLIDERKKGIINITLRQISVKCFVTYQFVRKLSMHYNHRLASIENGGLN